jgi:class 3 adenylate cyclase
MSKQDLECAILFADIAGSTRIYQSLGDEQAQACIAACLTRLTDVAARHEGVLIKTIGDEIMCRFPSADAALQAACTMHETMRDDPPSCTLPMSVRIGTHYGPVILEGGDVFGDAVNVGSRLVDIAKAGQIITTDETVERTSRPLRDKARLFDRASLPGRADEVRIYEVLWEANADVTMIARITNIQRAPFSSQLRIMYAGGEVVQEPTDTVTIGRDLQCNLVVASELASRQHARIEYSRGKFVLTDQSTNGTFVQIDGSPEVYLRREALPLSGTGAIALGRSCAQETEHLIRFACE